MKKYVLTDETKQVGDTILHRIRAASDFYILDTSSCEVDTNRQPLIKITKGIPGGWIESEANLSQDGLAWVADEACVYGKGSVRGAAVVSENAKVDGGDITDFARVYGRAKIHAGCISDHSRVYDDAEISRGLLTDWAQVYGNAWIVGDGELEVSGHARLFGNVRIDCGESGVVTITGSAKVYGDVRIAAESNLSDVVEISGNADVSGNVRIKDCVTIKGNSVVKGYAYLSDCIVVKDNACIDISQSDFGCVYPHIPAYAVIGEDAYITSSKNCLTISSVSGDPCHFGYLTFYTAKQGGIYLYYGGGNAPIPVVDAAYIQKVVAEKQDFSEYAELIASASEYAIAYFKQQASKNTDAK